MRMTKYGKYESDGLLSTKLMRWTMVDEMNRMDFGLWTQQEWSSGKMMQQHKHNWGKVKKHKQDDGTRWLQITYFFYN